MKKQNYFILVILISIFYFTFGCGGPKASSEASTAPPQVVAEVPFVGTFYLATYMGKSATTYITHKLIGGLNVDSDWTQSCTVPRSDLSTPAADIQCIAEAHELDIWAQGVTLAASFPAGFCDYVEEAPYFYFKYLPGVGPAAPPYSVAEPTCLYDYTKQEGPNCCSGEWTMPAGPSPATQPSRSGKYGGKFSNCYSGSGIKDFIASNSGVPGIKIYQNTNLGGRISRLLPGYFDIPISEQVGSNIRIANYFRASDHAHASNVPGLTFAPVAFDYQADSFTGYTYPTNPFYIYTCFDTNKEIKARITLLIRDWNIVTELHQGGNPDTTGSAASGDIYNDYFDWKDFNTLGALVFPGRAE